MKKFLAVLGLLFTTALAEKSGWVLGLQIGYSSVDYTFTNYYNGGILTATPLKIKGTRWGILGGRKSFWGDFGLRYYGKINYANYDDVKEQEYLAGLDIIYNIIEIQRADIGIFCGGSYGLKVYDAPVIKKYGSLIQYSVGIRYSDEWQSVEIFYTKDFRGAADSWGKDITIDYGAAAYYVMSYKNPSAIGVRYTFSF